MADINIGRKVFVVKEIHFNNHKYCLNFLCFGVSDRFNHRFFSYFFYLRRGNCTLTTLLVRQAWPILLNKSQDYGFCNMDVDLHSATLAGCLQHYEICANRIMPYKNTFFFLLLHFSDKLFWHQYDSCCFCAGVKNLLLFHNARLFNSIIILSLHV